MALKETFDAVAAERDKNLKIPFQLFILRNFRRI